MSHDYCGECRQCHALNSYSVFDCRECGARLPWADALTQKLFEGQHVASKLEAQPQWVTPSAASSKLAPTLTASPLVPARQLMCAHCGSEHSADAVYCPRCGTRVLSTLNTVQPPTAPSGVHWPLGLQQPAATLSNAPSSPASLSPQQNVNVNVVTHQQDSNIAIKSRRRGGFAWRLAFMLFLIAGYLIMVGAPFQLWMGFMFAGAAICVLRAL